MPVFTSGEFAEFNGSLASVVERGLKLEAAADLLVEQAGRRSRPTVERLAQCLRDGEPLLAAMARFPEAFPQDYRVLVEAGLSANRVGEVFRSSEVHYALRARVARRLLRVGVYLAVTVLICLLLLAGGIVMSRMVSPIMEQINVETWWARRGVARIAVAGLLGASGFLVLLFLVPAWIFYVLGVKRGVGYWIPLWGRILKHRDLALFCTSMALNVRAGATPPEALQDAARIVRNGRRRRVIEGMRDRTAEGAALSDALFEARGFPEALAWSVSLAERRGDTESVLESFGRIYNAQAERGLEVLLQILTPLGIILAGNVVFFTAAQVFGPLIDLLTALSAR